MRLQPVEQSDTRSVEAALLSRHAEPGFRAPPAGCEITRRHSRECALFRSLTDLTPAASAILAAHAAGSFARSLPASARQPSGLSSLAQACLLLAGPLPGARALDDAIGAIARAAPPDSTQTFLDDRTRSQIAQLWDFASATEQLLVQGGDDRLALDPETGLNRYGCTPYPRPDVIAFSSCTASSITEPAYLAAEAQRRALLAGALSQSPDAALEEGERETSQALMAHFGIEEMAEAMLVASGTDAALLVTALVAAAHPGQGLTSILMSPAETGSGVPQAVQGRHFSQWAASGEPVPKGAPLDGLGGAPALQTIALRDEQGRPRAAADVAAACETAVGAAISLGHHAVLHAIDGSKTGLAAPDRATLQRLAARHGRHLTIVLDACQIRIEPSLIRTAVGRGYIVLVTGSKFFSAPGFCGAVLLPRNRHRPDNNPLPPGLLGYATMRGGRIARRCPGLLLRWAAALRSMRDFAAAPHEAVRVAIDRLGADTRAFIMRNAHLRLIAAPRPTGAGWSGRSSVLTFAVRSPSSGDWMSPDELRPLYLALAADSSSALGPQSEAERATAAARCQIGQPVGLGSAGLGGLRIAFSADQLVAGDRARQRQELQTVFAKIGLLLGG